MPPFEGLDLLDELHLLEDDDARDLLHAGGSGDAPVVAATISITNHVVIQETSVVLTPVVVAAVQTVAAPAGLVGDPGYVHDIYIPPEDSSLSQSITIPAGDAETGGAPPVLMQANFIVPTDPGLDPGSGFHQWHLNGTYGINAQAAWDHVSGKAVRVAVFDDGFNYTHSEFTVNYKQNLDFDTTGANDLDANASGAGDNHGTAVMGVIGADNNGLGVVGAAFDSELIGIRRSFSSSTYTDVLEGFQHARTSDADVMNNSWGSTSPFNTNILITVYSGNDSVEVNNEVINLVNLGRDGLGTSIVFAAGNSRAEYANTNTDNLSNSPYVITVGAIDANGTIADYSTPGASILVSAPGSGIWTTDRTGANGYVAGDVVGIDGTSFAAPIVSAVIALLYEANPNLGYRDVQEILAYTARNDLNDADAVVNVDDFDQVTNAHVNGGRDLMFSHDFGYGLVDAGAAVRLAKTWTVQQTYTNMQTVSMGATPNLALGTTGTYTTTISVGTAIEIEKILIDVVLPHQKAGDLIISLISPTGTESVLVDRIAVGNVEGAYVTNPHGAADGIASGIHYQFSTSGHLGELSSGTWTLKIVDSVAGNSGTLNSWNLKFLGSAQSDNDTYVFNNNLSGSVTITDTAGADAINLSALDAGVTFNLGVSGTVNGKGVTIANGTVIETLYATDFNDTITDAAGANSIHLGAGDDSVTAVANGNDTFDGQAGNDTVIYSGVVSNFTFETIDATTIRVTDNVGNFGIDTLKNFETFRFNGTNYTMEELQNLEESSSVTQVVLKFGWGSTVRNIVSNVTETRVLTAEQLGLPGHTGAAAEIVRTSNSLTVTNLNTASTAVETFSLQQLGVNNISVDGFRNNTILLSAATQAIWVAVTDAMYGRIDTGSGNDTISVAFLGAVPPSAQTMRLSGGAGDDAISTTGVHSNMVLTVLGGDGHDTIIINTVGSHIIQGDAGNDTITGSNGAESIYGGTGADTIYGAGGNDTVYGGSENDLVYGGNGNDHIQGEAGDDTIHGEAGVDFMRGGDGNDSIYGGANNDTIYGDAGNDVLYGDAGTDFIIGGFGDDLIYGGSEWDKLWGDEGNDIIRGADGNDLIYGGADNDTLYGDGHADKLWGGDGNDTMFGGDAIDYLYGENGNDIMDGGAGVDYLYGGAGMDTFVFTAAPSTGMDRVNDFTMAQWDRIDVSDLLTGFVAGVTDIDNFVRVADRGGNRADVQVNLDGMGTDWLNLAIVYGNLIGTNAQTLYNNGQLIAV